jgi:hypothetical protein
VAAPGRRAAALARFAFLARGQRPGGRPVRRCGTSGPVQPSGLAFRLGRGCAVGSPAQYGPARPHPSTGYAGLGGTAGRTRRGRSAPRPTRTPPDRLTCARRRFPGSRACAGVLQEGLGAAALPRPYPRPPRRSPPSGLNTHSFGLARQEPLEPPPRARTQAVDGPRPARAACQPPRERGAALRLIRRPRPPGPGAAGSGESRIWSAA